MNPTDVVITGVGVVSPIGIGAEAFQKGIREQQSGIRRFPPYDRPEFPVRIAADVKDFQAKDYIPRKMIKVMCRDIQLGVAAASLACQHAGLNVEELDPERRGVVCGTDLIHIFPEDFTSAVQAGMENGKFNFSNWGSKALPEIFPLWMLRQLPNMVACQIAILLDARGPNNTITLDEASSLIAINEAAQVIQRGQADLMVAGGAYSRVHLLFELRSFNTQISARYEEPEKVSRPFDLNRDGLVNGEGAGFFVLESREHAERRGANILAQVVSGVCRHEPAGHNRVATGRAIRQTIEQVLADGKLTPQDIGHVNAHGRSTTVDDRVEAQAIASALGDVPVTAMKSYFGDLGTGSGAVELAASVLNLDEGYVPVTLNYETPDPECPINVVQGEPLTGRPRNVLKLNQSYGGQAAAILVAKP